MATSLCGEEPLITESLQRKFQEQTMVLRKFEYGHGNAIIILVGELMGLSPSHIDDAKKTLGGGAIHPMTGAAIEQEAIRMNDLLRHDPQKIEEANRHAGALKLQYGFRVSPAG